MIGRLPGIAVAAATEHQDEAPGHEWTQRSQRLFERVGLVRIIDEDARAPDVADALKPTRRAFELLQRVEHRVRVAARGDAKPGRDQRIGDLKIAGQRKLHTKAATAKLKVESRRQSVARGGVQSDCLAFGADGDDVKPAPPAQPR